MTKQELISISPQLSDVIPELVKLQDSRSTVSTLLALRVHLEMNAAEVQVIEFAAEVLSIVALNITPAEMTREG